jgi:hypothetical protein
MIQHSFEPGDKAAFHKKVLSTEHCHAEPIRCTQGKLSEASHHFLADGERPFAAAQGDTGILGSSENPTEKTQNSP